MANEEFSNIIPPVPVSTGPAYAGFWARFIASVLDNVILGFLSGLLGFLYFWFVARNSLELLANAQDVVALISFIIWIIYFPFMESQGGATIGKKMLGIKVIGFDGQSISFLRSLGRNLGKILSGLILGIGYIMAGFTERKQALHDIISKSLVVKTRETSVAKMVLIVVIILVVCGGSLFFAGMKLLVLFAPGFDSIETIDPDDEEIPFVATTATEYDAIMSQPVSGLEDSSDYEGSHIFAGPAIIAFDDFWGLNVALPIIPNLEEGEDYAWIDLTSVVTVDGKEVLNKESAFETDVFFTGLTLFSTDDPVSHLYARRRLTLLSDTEFSAVKVIKGSLLFKIPLGSADSNVFYEKSYPFTLNVLENK